ncbi:MAG: hypothetical protein CVU00_04625 [Bacteroidetes bacterium HGW-Bacteroidetes-17]|jgi:hypothetical protein|nr:MAG: hypothetical protein CVU00_04625 [Bacteroidetes bacterium HGW-Bacteroidetes-17]
MKTDFIFVDPIYDEIFEKEQKKDDSKVIYFGNGTDLEEAKGKITGTIKNSMNEEYLCFNSGAEVRIDRIITINGIPGPAYGEYDSYALACLDCTGGME